ncbi:MAG TPA: hypothetical protein VFZ97_06775 [Acidimicrobiales bacterium]
MTDQVPYSIPGLNSSIIRRSASTWGDGGLWEDILRLSGLFWAAETEVDGRLSWHHLVLAVGNFKRQPGRRLRPAALTTIKMLPTGVKSEISIPVQRSPLTLKCSDLHTWKDLSLALPGSAVATTTSLLAALWPDCHFIFDWRVHAAANGLRIAHGEPPTADVDPDSVAPASETFEAYVEVRDWVLETADCLNTETWEVERALYGLSQRVSDSDNRTWRQYGEQLTDLLHRPQ